MYHSVSGAGQSIVSQFEKSAKDWLIAMGYPEDKVFEASDSWIDWKANKAPYNITAQDDVKATLAMFEEWDAPSTPKI